MAQANQFLEHRCRGAALVERPVSVLEQSTTSPRCPDPRVLRRRGYPVDGAALGAIRPPISAGAGILAIRAPRRPAPGIDDVYPRTRYRASLIERCTTSSSMTGDGVPGQQLRTPSERRHLVTTSRCSVTCSRCSTGSKIAHAAESYLKEAHASGGVAVVAAVAVGLVVVEIAAAGPGPR